MQIQEFDFSVNLLQSLLWHYNDAVRLQSILQQKQDWYNTNQTQFWTDWYNNVFNLQTANDFGLAVWSIILEVPLSIGEPDDPPGKPIFGFGGFNQNFENGNFSSNGGQHDLTTEEKRLILRFRYFQLISRGAIPEINQFLKYIFGSMGEVYVLDGLDMTITVVFDFPLTDRLQIILDYYDLIPRPAAVGIRYINAQKEVFGFGSFNQNFENGNFIEEG